MLITLVSCSNGGSGNSSSSKSLSQLNTGLGVVRRGMIVQDQEAGQRFHIQSGTTNSVSIENSNEVTEKVLIAIRGNKLYFYSSDEFGKNVEVETVPTQSEVQTVMNTPGNQVVGSRLIINQPNETRTDTYGEGANTMTLSAEVNFFGSLNMQDLYCDAVYVIKHTNIRVTQNGAARSLPDTTMTNTTTCRGVKTVDQLKDIDLRDVTICDGDDCKDHENVSDLTSDL